MTELITQHLNEPQHEAVTAEPKHLLILAGAGSGKTRVLVHRIAYLIETGHATPYSILAVTFTNKAAKEMRDRIEALLNRPTQGMWVGTFHGLAHRLLRTHWKEAGLPEHFQIMDSDDQHRLIRRIIKTMQLDETKWPPKQAQWFINNKKDEGIRPHAMGDQDDVFNTTMLQIYETYEKTCQQSGLVDFAELLLRAYEMWQNNPELLAHYQARFNQVLVDEFQDTNGIQYAWLRLLAGDNTHFTAVGDDDQSIYGWRGAKIENIQRFTRDYPGTYTLRLEQNYRSTSTILNAANTLISHNTGRLGKELWTAGEKGDPIALYAAFNEQDEARYIVERISSWVASPDNKRSDVAILYRSNAQSRVLEEALLKAGIPYRIYGGQRFFERAEIKDALAYLRLMANRHDDAAFERAVNMPTRGIGGITLDIIRSQAREREISLWQSTENLINSEHLSSRASTAVGQFLELISTLARHCEDLALEEQIEKMLQTSGLLQHYQQQRNEKAQARVENLEELANAAAQFTPPEEDTRTTPLVAFLSHAALEAGEMQASEYDDCVQMMTLHSAKGLEFPFVFLAGMEEGLFPHQMSLQEEGRLEEERRLCYVGITRARKKIVMTHAETRRLHGREMMHAPSRFISELPNELVEHVRAKAVVSRPSADFHPRPSFKTDAATNIAVAATTIDGAPVQLGQRVKHAKFGEGVVLNCEGQGEQARLQVYFESVGSKWLVASFAKLESLS